MNTQPLPPKSAQIGGGLYARQILRLPTVMAKVGMGRSWIYREIAAGQFPAPVKIGRASGWDAGAIEVWISERLAAAPRQSVES